MVVSEPKWKVNEEGIVVLKRRHRYRNGDVYEGEWIKGFPQGVGRIEYRNGDVYEGKVSMCVPNGNGSLIFMQGKRKYQVFLSFSLSFSFFYLYNSLSIL